MLNYFTLIRPLNLLLALISVGISINVLGISFNDLANLYPLITVGFLLAGANILNDIFDIKIDSINLPDKPLPSGNIAVPKAGFITIIFMVAGLLSLLPIQPAGQKLVIFIILPIFWLYTPIFKGIPIIGNVMIGATLGLVFLFTEAALTNQISRLWFPAFLAFHLTFNRELIKDLQDMKGDRKNGIVTLPIWMGERGSMVIYIISSFLLLVWPVYFINHGAAGKTSLYLFSLGIIPALTLTVFYLIWRKEKSDYKLLSYILKVSTVIGMVVIFSITL